VAERARLIRRLLQHQPASSTREDGTIVSAFDPICEADIMTAEELMPEALKLDPPTRATPRQRTSAVSGRLAALAADT